MSDDVNLGNEDEAPEETPKQDPRDAEIQRLRKDAADAKAWARTEAAKRLSTQYGVEITPDRLKKVGDLNSFEEILSQVKGNPQAAAPEPTKPEVPEGFDRLDQIQKVATPGGSPEPRPSAKEAARRLMEGEWTPQQHEAYLTEKYTR